MMFLKDIDKEIMNKSDIVLESLGQFYRFKKRNSLQEGQ